MLAFDYLSRFKSFLSSNGNHPQKKQIIDFSWEIEVVNISLEPIQEELFLPLPLELPGQKIIQESIFMPLADKIAMEEVYYNHYATWKVLLEPGKKKIFSSQFRAEIHPVNFLLGKKFILSDYAPAEPENKIWLSANRFIHPENLAIRKIAKDVAGAEKDIFEIIKKLNAYTVNHLKYGQPILGLYSTDDALNKDLVDCGGFASFLVSLCISLGIPARIVSGFWAGYSDNAMHVWVEIQFPDGSWLPADPTVENLRALNRTKKTGQLGFIGSDRIIFSHGCDLEISTCQGKIKIDILQNPFISDAAEKEIMIKPNLKTRLLSV